LKTYVGKHAEKHSVRLNVSKHTVHTQYVCRLFFFFIFSGKH